MKSGRRWPGGWKGTRHRKRKPLMAFTASKWMRLYEKGRCTRYGHGVKCIRATLFKDRFIENTTSRLIYRIMLELLRLLVQMINSFSNPFVITVCIRCKQSLFSFYHQFLFSNKHRREAIRIVNERPLTIFLEHHF